MVVHGENEDIETYALVDSGANVTLARQDLFDELGLKPEDVNVEMVTVDGVSDQTRRQRSTINVSSVDGESHVELNVYTIDVLNVDLNNCATDVKQ